ncbi:MAG: hypothetical protein JO057_04015, partial [Chloroflexi bacterium]|nr:hypothetical protein [Chloroflexota bacterium]
ASVSVDWINQNQIRVRSDVMDWTVDVSPVADGRPFILLEIVSDLTSTHSSEIVPVVAVLDDGRSFLLSESGDLAEFTDAVARSTAPLELAQLITHFQGRGAERVLPNGADLSPRGLAALHDAGADADAPSFSTQPAGGWTLDFVSVAYRPHIVDGDFGVDLRAWTVRHLAGDGVEWQSRPLAVDVPGALSRGNSHLFT